jgi:gamma-glutamyltranspeptidase
MVSSGHSLASLAGIEILKAAGNAFDAGVAVHLALCILQPDYVGFVGVAPFIGYCAKEGKVVSYSGLGVAPKRATIEYFKAKGFTSIPDVGILGQLIPATVDTDVAILQRYGTMSFWRVAAAAIELAEHGFPAHRFMSTNIQTHAANVEKFPYNASIFFQTGGPPKLNDMFYQEAIEAPRFGSYNFPDSFAPHPYYPGRLSIEARLETSVGDALRGKGHRVHRWADWTALAGAVCGVLIEPNTPVLSGGADPRREAYAIGW